MGFIQVKSRREENHADRAGNGIVSVTARGEVLLTREGIVLAERPDARSAVRR
jgi:hypothetical protein